MSIREGDKMDYKELYLKMMRETEKAIDVLIKAQSECEEMFISMCENEEQKCKAEK